MSSARWLQAAANGICILVGVFAGLAIAEFEGFESWLREWQTLVAGFLAIVAAGVTVAMMDSTDVRAQIRHDQLVRLSLRADSLRAERASDRRHFLEFDLAKVPNSLLLLDDEKSLKLAEQLVKDANEWRRLISTAVNHRFIVEAEDLFGGTMAAIREAMIHDLDGLGSAIHQLAHNLQFETMDLPQAIQEVNGAVGRVHSAVGEFMEQLEMLGIAYA